MHQRYSIQIIFVDINCNHDVTIVNKEAVWHTRKGLSYIVFSKH